MKNRTAIVKALNVVLVLALILSGLTVFVPAQPAATAGGLTLTIIAAPNLVVDSNALSPSTYAPKVATVIAKICNTTTSAISGVTAYIGDYTAGTPGIYPAKTDPTVAVGTSYELTYRGTYAFEHLGGTADGTRFIGSVPANTCTYQYWSFEYPHYAIDNSDGSTITTWGVSVKPDDDLSLNFDMWVSGNGGAAYDNKSHTMTMRNEISAMANKIKPNGNPAGEWFNTDTSTVYPGQTVTTNGILYRLGNINQGFDNDGDGVPDYNAWVQPFGDPAYDPSCFRLVGVTGVLTVTRGAGNPDMIIPIYNNLYFSNLPPDNTDVRGEVFYEFLALGGACTVPITPYQEVASGFDNEKFNGDYGTGVPALMSYEPEVDITKSGPGTQATGTAFTYTIPFVNNSPDVPAGLTLTAGGVGVNAGLMISDTVPLGLQYVAGSAGDSVPESTNSIPSGNSVTIYFSTDGGATWTTTDPGNYTSTSEADRLIIQWWLNEPLDDSNSGNNSGNVRYRAVIPSSGYIGSPFVENCAEASFGDAAPFDRACVITMVEGTGTIGDRVWADTVLRDGLQTTGELGISGIKVSLYYDKNGDGKLDINDVWLMDQDTSGTGTSNYDFTGLSAGDYIVKVDAMDSDLPTGYTLTTAGYYAVTLSAGQNYDDADFGFGPTLEVQKSLVTPDPAVVGETVTFKIDLINQLPGDGTATGGCVYYVWPTTIGTGNFVNPSYAAGAPDGQYATVDLDTGSGRYLSASSFSSGGRTSNVTSVEAVARLYLAAKFNDDTLNFEMTGGAS
ncbi:MAG: hypothetical protein JXR84_16205, partial [Anaerolineae bacterium]|nr:hypothetical protein [Anaerolineae bacterium]